MLKGNNKCVVITSKLTNLIKPCLASFGFIETFEVNQTNASNGSDSLERQANYFEKWVGRVSMWYENDKIPHTTVKVLSSIFTSSK